MAQLKVHYHCPSCGAPQSDARRGVCDYCNAPRVPIGTPDPSTAIRCDSCHTLVAGGSSFCLRCGNAMAQFDSTLTDFGCPHCKEKAAHMTRWGIAPSVERSTGFEIDGCTHCGGVWIQQSTLNVMLSEASEAAQGREIDAKQVKRRVVTELSAKIEYRRCPVCADLMARQNFQRVSGIILDSCPDHGTYFDAGELEDTLEFVRSGGLVLAHKRIGAEDERLSRLEAANKASIPGTGSMGGVSAMYLSTQSRNGVGYGEEPIGQLTLAFLRWGAGWTLKMGKRVWLGLRK